MEILLTIIGIIVALLWNFATEQPFAAFFVFFGLITVLIYAIVNKILKKQDKLTRKQVLKYFSFIYWWHALLWGPFLFMICVLYSKNCPEWIDLEKFHAWCDSGSDFWNSLSEKEFTMCIYLFGAVLTSYCIVWFVWLYKILKLTVWKDIGGTSNVKQSV